MESMEKFAYFSMANDRILHKIFAQLKVLNFYLHQDNGGLIWISDI
jgi:hypothetical protein